MDKQAFIAAVKAAGIVGEGGAGFPAHVKYAADADTVIANGCECEPLLHTDQHHMLHHANEIVRAFSELMQATGAKRGVIALKKKYKEATKILTDAIGNRPIELALLPNFYPAGDEQTLVREVTGRSVPPLGLPLMVGAVVANVGTLVSVAHALDGKPVTHKFLTVTGEVKKPGIVCVPIGTPLSACLEAAGGPTVSDPVFVLGGPMMGRMVDNADALPRKWSPRPPAVSLSCPAGTTCTGTRLRPSISCVAAPLRPVSSAAAVPSCAPATSSAILLKRIASCAPSAATPS